MALSDRVGRLGSLLMRGAAYQAVGMAAALVGVGSVRMVMGKRATVNCDQCQCGSIRFRLVDHEGMDVFSVHLGPCWEEGVDTDDVQVDLPESEIEVGGKVGEA